MVSDQFPSKRECLLSVNCRPLYMSFVSVTTQSSSTLKQVDTIVIEIVNSKFIKRQSKAERGAPGYSGFRELKFLKGQTFGSTLLPHPQPQFSSTLTITLT